MEASVIGFKMLRTKKGLQDPGQPQNLELSTAKAPTKKKGGSARSAMQGLKLCQVPEETVPSPRCKSPTG